MPSTPLSTLRSLNQNPSTALRSPPSQGRQTSAFSSTLHSPNSALNFPHSALRSQFLISPTYINVPLNAPFGLAELLKIWYNRMKVIMPHNAAGRRLCVYITAVRLYCFRSYTELRFEPAKGLNVIVGANAAGKTNILESVFLAALGRSHRTRRDAELINSLSDKAYAGIELVSAAGKHSIELKLFSGAPKQVFIDGQRIRRMGELMGVLNAVMFSPEDLSLVKDSPETRRRFMDMELCQLRPAYFYRLQQYNACLLYTSPSPRDQRGSRMPSSA